MDVGAISNRILGVKRLQTIIHARTVPFNFHLQVLNHVSNNIFGTKLKYHGFDNSANRMVKIRHDNFL